MVKEFAQRELEPIVSEYERDDIVPLDVIEKMKAMGLFGITVPEEYGGMGLDYTTFAMIFEELSKTWMSISGVIGTHHIMAYLVANFGTSEQKHRFLPAMSRGEKRGGLALTEPNAGSDVQSLELAAVKDGEEYVLTGTKMFITNGRYGDTFALLAKTDGNAVPAYRGLSCFIVEKGGPGFEVGRDLDKLGYRGLDTCELIFQGLPGSGGQSGGGRGGEGVPASHEWPGDGTGQHCCPGRGGGHGGL